MNTPEAFKIVGLHIWFFVGALSVAIGWMIIGNMKQTELEQQPLISCFVLAWTIIWTAFFIVKGWPL